MQRAAIHDAVKDLGLFSVLGVPIKDHKPVTRKETEDAAKEGVDALVRGYLSNPDYDQRQKVIAIYIQKGNTLGEGGRGALICSIAIRDITEDARVYTFTLVVFPPAVQQSYQQTKDAYETYGILFGEKIKEKEFSLLETLRPEWSEAMVLYQKVVEVLKEERLCKQTSPTVS